MIYNEFLTAARKEFGTNNFTRKQVNDLVKSKGLSYRESRLFMYNNDNKVSRGIYTLDALDVSNKETEKVIEKVVIEDKTVTEGFNVSQMISYCVEESNLIPQIDPLYVSFGAYKDLDKIISSREFFPVYISGLSGNGKTHMITQVCAENKRELCRVNITIETDEDDLIGGFRLVKDKTLWFDGPVVRAMKTGGVVLLDEINLGSNKIMCLQSVLEGKGIFIKKINQYVKPEEGFTIIATANTKGQGDESGKFIGSNLLNEAFLERFNITIEQDYPTEAEEGKILKRFFKSKTPGNDQAEFVKCLTSWAKSTRDSYKNGTDSEVITTRRLIHIARTFQVFADREKSIRLCLARFDQYTQNAMWALYEAMDPSICPKVEDIKLENDPLKDLESILGTDTDVNF